VPIDIGGMNLSSKEKAVITMHNLSSMNWVQNEMVRHIRAVDTVGKNFFPLFSKE